MLSVILITKNEARRITRCLRSVGFADEIIVVDSGSTDGTADIARGLGAQVHTTTDWPGFGPQKNRALALARGDWVLSIDADEEVTDALRDAILAVTGSGGADALAVASAASADPGAPAGYWIRRVSSFRDRPLHYGDWSRDRVLRLFRRTSSRFTDDVVHERVIVDGSVATLDGILLHRTVESLPDAYRKAIHYAAAAAPRLAARGAGGLFPAVTHSGWSFLRGFLLRAGCLDGYRGLQLAACNALGTYLRYRLAGLPPEAREAYVAYWRHRLGLENRAATASAGPDRGG